jgi:putative transposase
VARNYIHHNPVKHGYVDKWEDWLYSSAGDFVAEVGRDAVLKEWKEYPVMDMGQGWDD